VRTLDKSRDLESLVAKEDVIYLLLHSPQNTEILVSKLVQALLQLVINLSFRNSLEKHQHHSLAPPQSMPLLLPTFIRNFLFHLGRIGPSPFTKTMTSTYPHPHSTVLLRSPRPSSEHGFSHTVCQLLWS
jgi:hypothetical protein